jgi:hypothetical protein
MYLHVHANRSEYRKCVTQFHCVSEQRIQFIHLVCRIIKNKYYC